MNNYNVNKRQLKKWIGALDSGEYKQGRSSLQQLLTGGYCCLGVACKVLIPLEKQQLLGGKLEGAFPEEQEHAPEWLKTINNNFEGITGTALSRLNDRNKFTFEEIATCLELVYIHNMFK